MRDFITYIKIYEKIALHKQKQKQLYIKWIATDPMNYTWSKKENINPTSFSP